MALPGAIPVEAVMDYPCEKCGHRMRFRRSGDGQWFYGCSRWPDCHFTFDADQVSGAPIVHTRHGIPFRAERRVKGTGALFAALKQDGFCLKAGERLEQAKEKSVAARRRALKDMDRERVKARLNAASPETPEEWLEFVLSERLVAVQEHLNDEVRARQVLEKLQLRTAAAALQARRQRGR